MSLSGDVNLFSPEIIANPYPAYHALRAADPVHWEESLQRWILTRYDHVLEVLTDHRFSAARLESMEEFSSAAGTGGAAIIDAFSKMMLFTDPPAHTRLKSLVNKAFSAHAVESMRSHIQEVVDRLLDSVESRGRMDLVADLAYPLPTMVISEMLGVPAEERAQFKQWSDDIAGIFSSGIASPEQKQRAVGGLIQLSAYLADSLARLHDNLSTGAPGSASEISHTGLLAALLTAEEAGDRLTHQELLANAIVLMIAGHETTTNLIGNGVLALLDHPEELAKLRADPGLLPDAIEEMLRFDSPIQMTGRAAAEAVEVGGRSIQKGQFVMVVLAAANRDPDRFPDPDRLIIARPDNRHLAFAHGPHFCLGAPLARLEASIAIGTLLRRFPRLQFDTTPPAWNETIILRGLKSLALRF